MEEKNYTIVRTCQNCKDQAVVYINKRQAAFHLVHANEVLGNKCTKCGVIDFAYANEMPQLDAALIEEWATNEDLMLLEQDEDLILAHTDYIDYILAVLALPNILPYKRSMLLSALCVLIYDEVDEDINGLQKPFVQRILQYLSSQKNILLEEGDMIADYIQEVVFPLI